MLHPSQGIWPAFEARWQLILLAREFILDLLRVQTPNADNLPFGTRFTLEKKGLQIQLREASEVDLHKTQVPRDIRLEGGHTA